MTDDTITVMWRLGFLYGFGIATFLTSALWWVADEIRERRQMKNDARVALVGRYRPQHAAKGRFERTYALTQHRQRVLTALPDAEWPGPRGRELPWRAHDDDATFDQDQLLAQDQQPGLGRRTLYQDRLSDQDQISPWPY